MHPIYKRRVTMATEIFSNMFPFRNSYSYYWGNVTGEFCSHILQYEKTIIIIAVGNLRKIKTRVSFNLENIPAFKIRCGCHRIF